MAERTNPMFRGILLGPVYRDGQLVRMFLIVQQAGAGVGRNTVLEDQPQKEIHQLRVRAFAVLLGQQKRSGTADAVAEVLVLAGAQRQGQVLAEQERLAVEPGLAAVPALDRRRIKEVLGQAFESRRERGSAE